MPTQMARNRSQSPARAAVAEASEKTEGASLHAKLLNEFIGTLFLVLTIVLTNGDAIAIGAVLTVLVYSGGHISGGHYNPAVTFCAACHGGTPVGEAVQYAAVQVAGAVVGAITASLMANKHVHLTTGKGYDQTGTAIVELVFTAALCSVVIGTTETKNSYFGLAIGFTVLSAALAGGNVSGGAFNPAVVIGTTVGTIYSSGDTAFHWRSIGDTARQSLLPSPDPSQFPSTCSSSPLVFGARMWRVNLPWCVKSILNSCLTPRIAFSSCRHRQPDDRAAAQGLQ